jgi:hypothetical protein
MNACDQLRWRVLYGSVVLGSTLLVGSVCSADDNWSQWRNAQQSDSIQYRYKVTPTGADASPTCAVEVRNTSKSAVVSAVQASVTVDQTTGRVTMKRTLALDKSTQVGSDSVPNCKKLVSFTAIATGRAN